MHLSLFLCVLCLFGVCAVLPPSYSVAKTPDGVCRSLLSLCVECVFARICRSWCTGLSSLCCDCRWCFCPSPLCLVPSSFSFSASCVWYEWTVLFIFGTLSFPFLLRFSFPFHTNELLASLLSSLLLFLFHFISSHFFCCSFLISGIVPIAPQVVLRSFFSSPVFPLRVDHYE